MFDLNVGDKVRIINHAEKKYVGRSGKVIHVGNKPKPLSDRDFFPTRQEEPFYNIELDGGELLQNIKGGQIQKA
jgi:RNase P/RNase MRP subunit p29